MSERSFAPAVDASNHCQRKQADRPLPLADLLRWDLATSRSLFTGLEWDWPLQFGGAGQGQRLPVACRGNSGSGGLALFGECPRHVQLIRLERIVGFQWRGMDAGDQVNLDILVRLENPAIAQDQSCHDAQILANRPGFPG